MIVLDSQQSAGLHVASVDVGDESLPDPVRSGVDTRVFSTTGARRPENDLAASVPALFFHTLDYFLPQVVP